jgi:arylsulfatase A-like enzyme
MEPHEPYLHAGGDGPDSIEGYRRALRDLDAPLAGFLRDLRAARGDRRTIVVLAGDHGEEFGEHGGRYHGHTAHAENVRVAFVVAAPGLVAGDGEVAIDAPVSTGSIVATVLELLGIPAPCSVSLPSVLACVERREACPAIVESQAVRQAPWIGYTFDRYRVLYDREHHVLKAYDLRDDPYERRDLMLGGAIPRAERDALKAAIRDYGRRYCLTSAMAAAAGRGQRVDVGSRP